VRRLDWNSSLRVVALLLVAFWVAGTVLQALLSFDVLGKPPPEGPDFLDSTEAFFAFDRSHWPAEFSANALFALGFAALAGIGVLLSRLAGSDDARRSLGAATFLGAGVIGALSSLVWIAIKPVATSAHFCPCGFRAEEITSRLVSLGIADSLTMWLTSGAVVLAVVGLILLTDLASDAGMGRGWGLYSYLTAAIGLIAVVAAAFPQSPEQEPYAYYLTLLTGGVLIPLWALWIAIRAPRLTGPDDRTDSEPMDSEPPPASI